MTTKQYVALHVHTEHSLLDGAAKIKPLFAEVARLKQPAVAITDHGTMSGVAEFWWESRGTGVKPVIGIEAYCAPESRHHKAPVFWGNPNQRGADEHGEGGDVSGAGAYLHMTMLAENATGLRNLFRLSTLASFEGFYRKPRMDKELISQYREGIIATTGCPSGEVQTRLRLGQYKQALQAASDWRDIFGDRLYLELMDHGMTIERSVREGLLDIGRKLGLRPVATNDSHYITQDQAETHAALLCVQTRKTLDDPTRFKFDGDGYYLKSAAEMRGYWDPEVPGACDTTLLIANRVEAYDEVFTATNQIPDFPVPEGHTQESWLRHEIRAGLHRRFPAGAPAHYPPRIKEELSLIIKAGFPAYFLIVADLVRHAKTQNIRVGPGRGSVTGSLIAYVVGITEMDPLEHDLLFERFLNPERVMMPDIDLDFDERHRGDMIRYATEKYGEDRVAQIITHGTIGAKAAIKDATRVLGYPYAVGDRITRAMPPTVTGKDAPLSAITDTAHPRHGETGGLRALLQSDTDAAKVLDTARGLEGLIRQMGVHAAGVVISRDPLSDILPLWRRQTDGAIITQWDMDECEDIGLVKMDFLGLRTLTVLEDTLRNIQGRGKRAPVLEDLPLDDQQTYELLASGHTLGVFQLDAGIRDLLRQMRPTCFGDISAALALYRPGPIAAGAHLDYVARKNGRAPIVPIHPELAEPLASILDETFQLITYQEQVMIIAQRLAGYSLGHADILRKAIGKKKPEILAKEYEPFSEGMRSNGYSMDAVNALWDILIPFGAYCFNKSHSAAYGLIAYWTAYLKAHHPAEFMAAQLTSLPKNKDKRGVYLAECRRMSIRVLPPDVNQSGADFTATDEGIRVGLTAVRNVGAAPVQSIIDHRPYSSFPDFLGKVGAVACTKQVVASLITAGAFDSLGHPRRALHDIHERAVAIMGDLKKQDARGQGDLFSATISPLAHLPLNGPEWPRQRLLALERDMLGLYVSAHPLDGLEPVLRAHAPRPIAVLLQDAPQAGEITIAGIITAVKRKVNAKGEPWVITTVEDLDASIEVVFFARTYTTCQERLIPDTPVGITGRVQWREDMMNVIADEITTLDTALPEPPLVLRVGVQDCTTERLGALRALLLQHPGNREVRLVVVSGGRQCLLGVDKRLRVESSDALRVGLEELLRPTPTAGELPREVWLKLARGYDD